MVFVAFITGFAVGIGAGGLALVPIAIFKSVREIDDIG